MLGFLVVPWVARRQIVKLCREFLHREASVERVRFNPFTLAASVEGFDLKDRDGADLFRLSRFGANLQVVGVFRRVFRFREIVIEQPVAQVRIQADGRLTIADLLEPKAAPPDAGPPKPFPRILVDRFLLSDGRVGFEDATRTPAFTETLAPLDLDLRELSTVPDESGEHAVTIGLEKGARIRWSGRQTVEPLQLDGRFELTGMSLPRIWEYAAPVPALEVRNGSMDLAWSYKVRRPVDGALELSVDDASLTVRDLAVRPRDDAGDDWLAIPLVEARAIHAAWPESLVEVGTVKVSEPRVIAWLDEHRVLNWQAALPPPAPATSATGSGTEAKPWTAKIGKVEIVGGRVQLEDRSITPAVTTSIDDLQLALEGVSSDLHAPVTTQVSLRINDTGQASVKGTLVPDPLAADLDVGLHGLDLAPFSPYASIKNATLSRGVAGVDGKLVVGSGSPRLRFDGALSVDHMDAVDAASTSVLSWEKTSVRGVRLTLEPNRLRVADIDLDRAFVQVIIDKEGKVNLTKVGLEEEPPAAAAPAVATPAAGKPAFPVDVTRITIRDAKIDYTDESLILPFATDIRAAHGTVRDLSTSSAAAARLDLEGRVSETGYVKAGGTIRIADPFASTDVSVTFRDVGLPKLTPYMATFAGYSIERGSLDLDVHYRVQDRRLVGDHRLVANDLTLGPKVEGAPAPGLPVRLAIALLKDKDGRIDLQVPIEGTVDSPEFAYSKILWQAVCKILGNIVKAPFRAIGRMFGHDEEDLDLIGFVSGRSDLLPPEQETIQKLAQEIAKKGELTVEVGGRFDPVADASALATARLEARIDAKRASAEGIEAILEALYAETFSPEKLEAERLKFMPSSAPPPEEAPKKKKRKKDEAPAPPPPKDTFDAAGFYDALRAELLEADHVDTPELEDLARARAAAIVTALTAEGGLDAARVKAADPAPIKRKKQGSDLVASELTLSAND